MRVIIFENVLKLHQFGSFRAIEKQYFRIERINYFKGVEKPQSIKHKGKSFSKRVIFQRINAYDIERTRISEN